MTCRFLRRFLYLVPRIALPLLLIAAAVRPARAQEPVTEPAPVTPRLTATPPDTFKRWYGWQTLLADAAGIGAVVGCGKVADNNSVEVACVTPFLLASPAVHIAHENPGRAALSFGMNLGLPFAGGAIGAALADCGGDHDEYLCGLGETALGLMAGLAVAITIDAAMAYDDVEAPRKPVARAPALLPTVSLAYGGAGVGLAGRF